MSCHLYGVTPTTIDTDDMLGEPPRDDEDKFGELFDKFMSMKGKQLARSPLQDLWAPVTANVTFFFTLVTETAKSLPHEQRKEFAEKVHKNVTNELNTFITYTEGCNAVLASNWRRRGRG